MVIKRKFNEKEREELLMEAKNIFLNYPEAYEIKSSEYEKDGTEIFA